MLLHMKRILAFLAGLAVGFWKSKDEILEHWKVEKEFTPEMCQTDCSKLYAKWKRAVDRVRSWETEE